MKKATLLIAALCIAFIQGCTTITTKGIPVEKVITIENTKQNELYVRANNWMVDAFKDAESVIQFTDKESGNITGRYLLGTVVAANQYGPAQYAYATINIKVKDNASKIKITPEPFTYLQGNIYNLYSQENADNDINKLIVSFENAMNTVENNDW